MVCIYCSGKTQVTNSRLQKKLNHTWRRRACQDCGALFSTNEAPDLASSVIVRHAGGSVAPFSRDKLFLSILRAVGHRSGATSDAGALTATIMAKLHPKAADAVLSPTDISSVAYQTLQRFDSAAAVQYRAYHPA